MNPYHHHQQPVPGPSRPPPQHGTAPYIQTGAAAAFAMRNALVNPYAPQTPQFSMQQPQVLWPQSYGGGVSYVTPEGYSISTAYNPMMHQQQQQQQFAPRGRGRGRGRGGPAFQQQQHTSSHAQHRSQQQHASSSFGGGGGGQAKCTYEGCSFSGHAKALEIHRMDRHLIYPPGYVHNKKSRDNWDADPALNNGKPVPIPGTGITLDTPEAIDAWIAERKKRWPSAQRVTEKKQKLDEAIARGDLIVGHHDRKRKRDDDGRPQQSFGRGRGRGRGQFQERGRARGRGRGRGGAGADGLPRPQPEDDAEPNAKKIKVESASSSSSSSESEDEDANSSGSDMDPVLDAVSSKQPEHLAPAASVSGDDGADLEMKQEDQHEPARQQQPQRRPPPRQPRPPPHNPFAVSQRPSLLRNLLNTEVRITVSNLSQAIRFIVQNDFFDGVELKPGDADKQLIEVIKEEDSGTTKDDEAQ